MMNARLGTLLAGLILAASVHAQEETAAAEEDKGPWSGNITFGFLGTSGNTETTSLNTSFGIGYATGSWEHGLTASALQASQDNLTSAEAYEVGWKSLYNLSEFNYLSGRLDWRKDRFAGVPEQFSQTVNYGRRILDTGVHILNAEIGAGARQSEDAAGVSNNDAILRAGLDYKWQFSETANFTQAFVIESGSSNTLFESVSAVTARLVGDISLVASYTIRNNSDVPVGTDKTDTRSAIALEYAF